MYCSTKPDNTYQILGLIIYCDIVINRESSWESDHANQIQVSDYQKGINKVPAVLSKQIFFKNNCHLSVTFFKINFAIK